METVTIIGAGASGLACMNTLINAKKYQVFVLEQSHKSARKILASGNGRCNVSNRNISITAYNTDHPIIKNIIEHFDVHHFFDLLSLKLRFEGNLIYPYSLSSLSVKNALLRHKDETVFIEQCEVLRIEKDKNYKLITNQGTYHSDKVVIATGSPANHLSGEHNLDMLKKLKVELVPFSPSLVQLKTRPVYKSLKGLRVKAMARLYDEQTMIDEKKGEVLFTDYGLSGICIMQLSRFVETLDHPRIIVDLLPDLDKNDYQLYGADGLFHEKLAALVNLQSLDPKHLSFDVIATMGIDKAQVCHGGVSLEEIDENLQLKKYPGIYVCGEALNVDGDCGGYNLHFAFASGEYVAKKIIGEKYVKNQ